MSPPAVPFGEAVRAFARIGLESFGGPAGQIAVMHRVLVDERRWIDEDRFLHGLGYCTLLPGPEAQQLATYLGWWLHGVRGGLVAGTLFVLPGFVVMLALAWLYASLGRVPFVQSLFFGVKAAVLALVLQALVRVGRRALRSRVAIALAASSFVALFFFGVPFPLVVVVAAGLGLALERIAPGALGAISAAAPAQTHAAAAPRAAESRRTRSALVAAAVALAAWLAPVTLLALVLPESDPLREIALFFSRMAVLTFGGAYAVLAWVSQHVVHDLGWLTPGEMLDGLGLAETTPGPLVLVLQFVGFLAAWRSPGALSPGLAGLAGAALTAWVTFVPSFVWIFAGAPWIERLRASAPLRAALAGITAAVAGVIANLALWLALHVLFARGGMLELGPLHVYRPELASLDLRALVIAIAALVATFRFEVGLAGLLAGSALAGWVLRGLGG